jgi:type II secretory pathway pseudopilin PulG
MNHKALHPAIGAEPHKRPVTRGRSARGVTLIETVLAVVILGLVTSAFAGALAFVYRAERTEDLRLASNELANRILLQYLDDESVVARIRGQPLDYGPSRFSWEIDVQRVAMNIKEPEPGNNRPRAQYKDRFEFVTVRVWLHSDAARGRFAANEQGPEPLAQLSRLLDPAAGRNNDAMMRLGKDQQRLMDLVVRMGIVAGSQPNQQNEPQSERGGRRNNRTGGR